MADAGWHYFVALPDDEGAAAAIGRFPTDGVRILDVFAVLNPDKLPTSSSHATHGPTQKETQ